ncbi:MAG TPA: glycosyltransferase [Thermoanaerobaculia bacterium]|nr:glycosyltransferase [Thermoanaerobaculia bacterium]
MKVSVSITTYNHERYIAEAIESVLMQRTSFDFELIVGEDRSRDRTREIVLDFERRYPEKVRAVLPEENLGGGGKRIFVETLRLCRGQYIAAMDGDDLWTSPEKLQIQADFLDAHPECSACYHDVINLYEDGLEGPPTSRDSGAKPFATLDDVVERCFVPACSPMFRREVVAELPAWYFEMPWGDWPLYILAAERGPIGHIDALLGAYRVHRGGMWSGLGEVEKMEGLVAFYRRIDVLLGFRHTKTIRHRSGRCYYRLASLYAGGGETAKARSCAWKALLHLPLRRHHPYGHLLRMLLRPP